ncbi:MAG: hypothetical protein JJE04_12730 [Acidobacteriia bacterium]|nr:hypothetical protein [Terriglobia bacterium]
MEALSLEYRMRVAKQIASSLSLAVVLLAALAAQTRKAAERPAPEATFGEVIIDADGRVIKDTRPAGARPTTEPVPEAPPVEKKAGAEGPAASAGTPATSPLEPEAETEAEPVPRPGEDPVIFRARLSAFRFAGHLPDFLCTQLTKRHTSSTFKPKWKVEDRVSAEVVYEHGQETYRDIKINGKPVKKKNAAEESGAWSSGEFGSLLLSLLTYQTDARFVLAKPAEGESARSTVKYNYTVEQKNSKWRVEYEGYRIMPAFKGQMWVEPATGRVERLEMKARLLPKDYAMDVVEMTVDYGVVRIGEKDYYLPLKSENLACQKDTFHCSRNEIEFKNYRKFTAESTISATDSSVTFDGAAAPVEVPTPAGPPPAASRKP